MKVVVTGGLGFIGSNFVRYILEQGHSVSVIDALTYAASFENIGEYQSHSQYTFYKEDICNKQAVQTIFLQHQPDVIVHMAAESHVDRSIECADDFIKTNVVGTYSVLNAALAYYKTCLLPDRFRFIHLSTDEVFGALGLYGSFNESMPYRPNSPYAASKASADHFVRTYHQTYKLPTITVHPSNNYGPRQYPEKLIPLMILNALEGKELPIYGDGQQVRDWLHVDDHVRALYALIKQGQVGQSYCVGSHNEISNKLLVEKICEILDTVKPRLGALGSYKNLMKFVKDRPGHDFRYASDSTKITEETGWLPRVSFDEGLSQTVQWYIDLYLQGNAYHQARQRIGLGQKL